MLWLIKDEKENDPSEEIFEFEDTFDKVLPELKLEVSYDNNTKAKTCKYYSKGIHEKDMIIRTLTKKIESIQSDDRFSDTDDNEDEDHHHRNELTIGYGCFGKELEVRESMEKEAEVLRNVWRGKQQKGKKQKWKKQ